MWLLGELQRQGHLIIIFLFSFIDYPCLAWSIMLIFPGQKGIVWSYPHHKSTLGSTLAILRTIFWRFQKVQLCRKCHFTNWECNFWTSSWSLPNIRSPFERCDSMAEKLSQSVRKKCNIMVKRPCSFKFRYLFYTF